MDLLNVMKSGGNSPELKLSTIGAPSSTPDNFNNFNKVNSFDNMLKESIERNNPAMDSHKVSESENNYDYNNDNSSMKSSSEDSSTKRDEKSIDSTESDKYKSADNPSSTENVNQKDDKITSEEKSKLADDKNISEEIKSKDKKKTRSNLKNQKIAEALEEAPENEELSINEILINLQNLMDSLKDTSSDVSNSKMKNSLKELESKIKGLISKLSENGSNKQISLKNLKEEVKSQLQDIVSTFKKFSKKENLLKGMTFDDSPLDEKLISKLENIITKLSKGLNNDENILTEGKTFSRLKAQKSASKNIGDENSTTGSINQKNDDLQKVTAMNSKNSSNDFNDSKEKQDGELNFIKNQFGMKSSRVNNLNNQQNSKGSVFDKQLQQLMDKARIVVQDGKNGKMTLKMNPLSLGKVNVNLGLENGVLTGKFMVESAEAKEALESSLQLLKDNLEAEGFALGEFDVNVQDHQQNFNMNEDDKLMTGVIKADVKMNEQVSQNYDASSNVHHGQINMVI